MHFAQKARFDGGAFAHHSWNISSISQDPRPTFCLEAGVDLNTQRLPT